jgi:hypothetical protein
MTSKWGHRSRIYKMLTCYKYDAQFRVWLGNQAPHFKICINLLTREQ